MPPPPNFDAVARLYRWAEYLTLGPLLQRTRTQLLVTLPPRRNALLLGDGDGRFLAALLRTQPRLKALAVDTSAAMLHLLKARNPTAQTLHANALRIDLDPRVDLPSTDLIVTHFFLDCLTQPELNTLTLRLSTQLETGTLWLLSDFALPSHPLLKPLAALYIRSLYAAFRLLTGLRVTQLPNPQQALTAAGFTRIQHHSRLAGLLYTELWQRH